MAVTIADIDGVLEEIQSGDKSLKRCLADRNISPGRFFELVFASPTLDERYCRAQAARAEILADEIVDISDTELDSQRARNRIDARRWYASKMKPAKYGERIDLNITQPVDINGALAAAKARVVLPTRYPAGEAIAEIVDIVKLPLLQAAGSEPVPSRDADIFS